MACSAYEDLQTSCDTPADKAKLKAVEAPHAGDWLTAPPLTAIGYVSLTKQSMSQSNSGLVAQHDNHTYASVAPWSMQEGSIVSE